jgi:hypothetical protein
MQINIRDGYVHLRNGDWFLTIEEAHGPSFVVARSLGALQAKAKRLRKRYLVNTTAWQQIGARPDAYTKPHHNYL